LSPDSPVDQPDERGEERHENEERLGDVMHERFIRLPSRIFLVLEAF
jgi:hypothetical protein